MTTITIEKGIDNLCMEMQERRIVELHDTIKEKNESITRLIRTIEQQNEHIAELEDKLGLID
jgi:uncharacterized coiled-coil protein SlyX